MLLLIYFTLCKVSLDIKPTICKEINIFCMHFDMYSVNDLQEIHKLFETALNNFTNDTVPPEDIDLCALYNTEEEAIESAKKNCDSSFYICHVQVNIVKKYKKIDFVEVPVDISTEQTTSKK